MDFIEMHRILTILACGTLLLAVAGCSETFCSVSECGFVAATPAAPVTAPAAVPGAVAAVPAEVAPAPPVVAGLSKPTTATVQDLADVKYYRSDEPLRLGIEHFNRGNYGIAERYFRDAVEKAPKDVTAWIALAASYDRVARFDLADRAYKMAIRLAGETTEILNNQGYSYMLRGDLVMARKKFEQAWAREPGNPTIANNLQLLNASYRYVQRNPG
jgi:Flp pilus assembly protein TadD